MQNAVGNRAGVIAPWLTGRIVRDTGHFMYAFAVVGVILGVGAASYLLIVGPDRAHCLATRKYFLLTVKSIFVSVCIKTPYFV